MENNINYLIGFIDNNLDKLIQIYIKERTNQGDGILLVKGDKTNNKVDVGYMIMDMIDTKLQNKIKELNYTKSKAYFFTFDVQNPNINSFIEKELR